jgi:acyl dehydratase
MVGRTLIKSLCGDDPNRTRRLNVRFSSPVYPGESLHVAIWNVAAGEAAFRLIATERNVVVQDFGQFEYQD